MRIFTFISTDPDSPVQAIARIWLGKAGWHPLIMGSINESSARQRAEEFWTSELAKAKAIEDKKAAKALSKAQPQLAEKEPVQAAVGAVEDPGDVI